MGESLIIIVFFFTSLSLLLELKKKSFVSQLLKMKYLFCAFLLLNCLNSCDAEFSLVKTKDSSESSESLQAGFVCNMCDQILGQGLNQLLNIVLNAGVIGTCGDLCGQLPQKAEATVCDLVCAGAGLDAFIHLIDNYSDYLDPLFFCMEAHACPIKDSGAGKITSVTVDPPTGSVGTTFNINFGVTITNATGTGTFNVEVDGPGIDGLGTSELSTGMNPGDYKMTFQLTASNQDASGDASNPGDEPVIWEGGVYTASIVFCEGDCNPKLKHNKQLSSLSGTFNVTAQ